MGYFDTINFNTTECPLLHYAYRSFYNHLFYDEICDGKVDCVYGIDEWVTHCDSHVYMGAIRCPRDGKIAHYKSPSTGYIECPLSNVDLVVSDNLKYDDIPDFCSLTDLVLVCLDPSSIPRQRLTNVLVINGLNGLQKSNYQKMTTIKVIGKGEVIQIQRI